jgi:hypothetical protein
VDTVAIREHSAKFVAALRRVVTRCCLTSLYSPRKVTRPSTCEPHRKNKPVFTHSPASSVHPDHRQTIGNVITCFRAHALPTVRSTTSPIRSRSIGRLVSPRPMRYNVSNRPDSTSLDVVQPFRTGLIDVRSLNVDENRWHRCTTGRVFFDRTFSSAFVIACENDRPNERNKRANASALLHS